MTVSTNYRTIDDHKGSTEMGCFIVCVDVEAHVYLQEDDDDGSLSFKIDYSYSGAKTGHGTTRVSVSGNTDGCKDVKDNVEVCYSITNFEQTKDSVSLDLTASVAHTSTPKMGPDVIFKDQRFSGSLSSVQIARSQARLASYAAIHKQVEKATGASVEGLYPRSS